MKNLKSLIPVAIIAIAILGFLEIIDLFADVFIIIILISIFIKTKK